MATLTEEETIIHERFLQLKAAALTLLEEGGGRLSDQRLVRLGYDCLLDSLDSIYKECSSSASLSKDKYISRFLKKYKPVMDDFDKLRLKETDFITKGIIGQGHFGEVRVVEEKTTSQIYAMKIMKKTHILQQADATFFIEERDIMALGNSQWLTKLHYAFQDEKCLYLVMDYHPGGDLFTVMERKEMGMNEGEACFYTAEIICALHDLHQLGFVHRDVKPDNVLITRSGHIKLVDFGSASRLDENGKVVDYTLPVGTPEYISPEVLTSLDRKLTYGVSCDWWSVGIIMYELLFEVTPFEGGTTAETYANIMSFQTSLHIPEELSPEARSLIESLLVRPEERLGYTDIVKHPFFKQVDWSNIASMAPPFVPVIKGPTDTSNFDSFDPIDDSADTNTTHKSSRSFTGKNLPFIGFSFTNWSSYNTGGETPHNIGFNELDACPSDDDVRVALKKCTEELRAAKEEKKSVEQECVIYRKQMMDLNRRLESERKERGTSNTKALQLLAEVRENNKIAKEMRDTENKEMSEQVQSALVQLEQERVSAVKRCQRAHEELKKKQNELDCCTAKLSDLKSKLAHVRERSKIDTSHLQDKLQRFSDDSKKRIMQLHNEYAELQDRYTAVNKELKQLKEFQLKQENATRSARVSVTSSKELEELKIELETQKHLTDQYNAKVLECKKELSLKTVQCQEMEKSLDLEAALKQNLQEKYDTVLKELKYYEEAEREEPKTTPTNSNSGDNISSLQEELIIQKQLTDEYNFKVLEYEKELGMKTVQCQEMSEALKLEQNLNNKLYDDIYHLRQEHGKLQAAHMKLSKQLKTQESRAAEASKETEQALQDKAATEEALELERTRMQIQLAQFTKLIDYRHNTPNASKKKNNPKKGIKLSRKKRDPEKERSEWMILKDIAKSSKDNKGDSRVSRSPSISSVLVDQATPGGQSVRSTRNNKQLITPGTTSSLVSSSSVAPTPSKSGIKRSAPDSSSAVLEHNIPHRWVIKSGAFHKSHSCSTCSGSIKHTQKYAKCAYCSFVVHQKCTSNTPNSCGLPLQLAAHLYPTSPSKRQCSQAVDEYNKENASFVSDTSSMDKMRRLSIDLVRCNTSIISIGTDLSITSSMLASNDSNDDSLV